MAYASDVSFLFMVAGSRCAVAGWLAAPRYAATAWQLQGSSLIARGVARVVSITLFGAYATLMFPFTIWI